MRDLHDAKDLAERLLEAVDVPMTTEDRDVVVSVSIGVAVGSAGVVDSYELVRAADRAMYEAKRDGKHGYSLTFSPVAPEG